MKPFASYWVGATQGPSDWRLEPLNIGPEHRAVGRWTWSTRSEHLEAPSRLGQARIEIRPRSGCQIWSKLADLLVGRRSSACNGYVTDPSSHDECVHRTQKHRKPLSETLHHARRGRHRAVARNQPHLALRPAPPRRPPHTIRWFRALAVIVSQPGHPPRSTVTTRKTRRLACYVPTLGPLTVNSSATPL